jgi:IS5 family transposase
VLFDEVGAMLAQRGLLMRQGTIVDATIIAAPSSTKNSNKVRDPQMHQTKKATWHFGMKAHIGVEVASQVVPTLTGTAANEADINQMAAVLYGRWRRSSPMPAIPGRTAARARRGHQIAAIAVVQAGRAVLASADQRRRLPVGAPGAGCE